MDKKLFIAEKPSVAKQLMQTFGKGAKYYQITKFVGYYEDEEHIFAAAAGHLFEVKNAKDMGGVEFEWKWKCLPFNPDHLEYAPIACSKGSYDCLKKLMVRKDIEEVIICTDPDQEGQLIFELIKQETKGYKPKKETRMWIDEWTPSGLKKAYEKRVANSDTMYRVLSQKGFARQNADWRIGAANMTVAATLQFGNGSLISVGRVQSPTLKIVVDRENEILNFKEQPYWTVSLDFTNANGEHAILLCEEKFFNKEEYDTFIAFLEKMGSMILTTEKNHKQTRTPKLFSLTSLQKYMNSHFKWSAQKTLDELQILYQAGYVTYPRTDMDVISQSAAQMSDKALRGIVNTNYNKFIADALMRSINPWCISKGGDMPHEAITPAYGNSNSSLPKGDGLILYNVVVERYIANFLPMYEYDETVLSTNVEYNNKAYTFQAKGATVTQLGWKELLTSQEDDVVLPFFKNGGKYEPTVQTEEKKTTAPARFSENTLLSAMEHAGNFVEEKEDETLLKKVNGIGTPATRANIIETLIKRDYIARKGNVLVPTDKGMDFVKVLGSNPICSPAFTAELERKMSDLDGSEMAWRQFILYVNEFIAKSIAEIQASTETISSASASASASSSSVRFNRKKTASSSASTTSDVVEKKDKNGNVYYTNGTNYLYANALERLGKKNKITLKEAKSYFKGDLVEQELYSTKKQKNYTAKTKFNNNRVELVF